MTKNKAHLHLKSFDEKDSFRLDVKNYNGHGHLQIFKGKELLTEAHVVLDSPNILTIYPSLTLGKVSVRIR